MAAPSDLVCFTVVKLDGTEISVQACLQGDARSLKASVEHACGGLGVLAFTLMRENGMPIDDADTTATLSDLDMQDGDRLLMSVHSTRDYTKINNFEKTIKCKAYPNGVLITEHGELISCHYSGDIQVYDAEFKLVRETREPGCLNASQMAIDKNGDLLVAFSRCVGVFDLCSLELKHKFPIHASYCRGLATAGNLVFVSDFRGQCIYVHSLTDGREIRCLGKGVNGLHMKPCGLEVMGDQFLAVCDRGNNKIQVIDFHGSGKHVADIGTGLLNMPNDIAVDPDGNLLVMDTGGEAVIVFREDGTMLAHVMPGWFKNHGNTFSYLAYNHATGAIAVSNNDEHCIAVLSSLF